MDLLKYIEEQAPFVLELCNIDPTHLDNSQVLRLRSAYAELFNVQPTAQQLFDFCIDVHFLMLRDKYEKDLHSN